MNKHEASINENEIDELINTAFSSLYNQHFNHAYQILSELKGDYPNHPMIPYGLAIIEHQQNNFQKAEALYLESINLNSSDAGCLYNLANLYKTINEFNKAEIYYKKSLSVRPYFFECINNLANLYKENDQTQEAKQYYKKALSLKEHPMIYFNLGHLCQGTGEHGEAEHYLQKALELKPNYFECVNNLASLYLSQEKYDLAEKYYKEALALNNDSCECHYNLANLYKLVENYDQAEKHYKIAMKLDPNYKSSHLNYALLKLLLGDYKTGTQFYENRATVRGFLQNYQLSSKLWNSEHSLNNKSILIIEEQGFGDNIHFVRFAKNLKEMGCKKIIFCCNPLLHSLISTNPYIDEVIANTDSITTDYHILSGSLMQYLDLDYPNLKTELPYLYADESKVKTFAKYFDMKKFKVGIAFNGNPEHRNNHNRSILFEQFVPLINSHPNVEFYSINFNEEPLLANHQITDLKHLIHDFSDTAAIIEHLDLLISIDSSPIHIAGALNKPCWLLLSKIHDWRWSINSDTTPWYPSFKLFRQKTNHVWGNVISDVSDQLKIHS
ncbi:tetratricopeptide repeat protein [Thiotrichales bacterium 19S11-10]|nr:tetratricopeptide repeat protein [Thiotrichales bacterium 19S11-10]